MTTPDTSSSETPADDSIVSEEVDQFVGDPEAATEATRERMAAQAEQEQQAGHPVSSARDLEPDDVSDLTADPVAPDASTGAAHSAESGHQQATDGARARENSALVDDAARHGDSARHEDSASPADVVVPGDAAVGGMPTDSAADDVLDTGVGGATPLGGTARATEPGPAGDPGPAGNPGPIGDPVPSEPAPQTAPSSVPAPDHGAPVPDVAPVPGVSPEPGVTPQSVDISGASLAPGAVSADEGSEWADPRGPH